MIRRELLLTAVTLALAVALFELYAALRPADLSDEIAEWLGSARGRFETYYAERRRRAGRDGSTPEEP